jgi:hypothetical protein
VKKAMLIKKKHSQLSLLAEVVGSNPTRSISFTTRELRYSFELDFCRSLTQ